MIHVHYGFLSVFWENLYSIAALERCAKKKRFSETSLNFWLRQDKILEILVLSEDSFIWIYIQSSIINMQLYMPQSVVDLGPLSHLRRRYLWGYLTVSGCEHLSQRVPFSLSKGSCICFCSVFLCQAAFSGIKEASSLRI